MNAISPFIFDSTLVIRTLERDGDPWFVAIDIARALGYEQPSKAVWDYCRKSVDWTEGGNLDLSESERSSSPVSLVSSSESGDDTKRHGGLRHAKIIPESDVYRLIMRSNKPDAERFQDWICEEVIPAIRKTGSYILAEGSETAALLKETEDTMARLKERRDALNLELRRLDKRRRRLGGEPLRLPGGHSYGTRKITDDDILSLIPPNGIRTSPLERLARERFSIAHGTFYRHWRQILKTEKVRREGVLVFRA